MDSPFDRKISLIYEGIDVFASQRGQRNGNFVTMYNSSIVFDQIVVEEQQARYTDLI